MDSLWWLPFAVISSDHRSAYPHLASQIDELIGAIEELRLYEQPFACDRLCLELEAIGGELTTHPAAIT